MKTLFIDNIDITTHDEYEDEETGQSPITAIVTVLSAGTRYNVTVQRDLSGDYTVPFLVTNAGGDGYERSDTDIDALRSDVCVDERTGESETMNMTSEEEKLYDILVNAVKAV